MNFKQKILDLIGISKRANMLKCGSDTVIKEIQSRRACVVFIANDASLETIKKFSDKCNFYNVTYITIFNTIELSSIIGKDNIKLISVSDKGLSKTMIENYLKYKEDMVNEG